VLITDTAFTAPAAPGSARDIAVKAFMGESLSVVGHPGVPGLAPSVPPPHGGGSDLCRAPGD
jgi:hypothetical protein